MNVTIHLFAKNGAETHNRNCPAVPQMRESGLRSVLAAHEQAADKADVALLDSDR